MKTLTEIPEWMSLKRAILTAGAELPGVVFTKLLNTFNEAATGLTTALNEEPPQFSIGPNNTYQQAWAAMLAGYRVRYPKWDVRKSWIFENQSMEIWLIEGNDPKEWKANGIPVRPSGKQQLNTNWIVLPIVDHEAPIV